MLNKYFFLNFKPHERQDKYKIKACFDSLSDDNNTTYIHFVPDTSCFLHKL